jgi:hypothetical protein
MTMTTVLLFIICVCLRSIIYMLRPTNKENLHGR